MANGSGVYGRGLTKSTIAKSLRELDTGQTGSYWDETVANYNRTYDDIRDAYAYQFNDAIEQAYASRLRRENLLQMSTIVGGGKQAALGQTQKAYEQAYDTYRQNLSEQNQSLSEAYMQDISNVNTTLEERSENFATFGNLHYDYLKYLFNKYYLESEEPTGPFTQDWFKDLYITTNTNPEDGRLLLDENGQPVLDENGNQLYEHLRSMQSLYNVAYDSEGNYMSVYDDDGFLTEFGRQYFDMIENMEYGQDVETFGDWLYGTNKDLWEYMYEDENIFDRTSDRTNAGTFRELTGRDSRDYTYSIAEHFSALSKGTIKNFFTDVYSDIESVFSGNLKDRAQSAINNSEQIVDKMAKLTKDLGLEHEFDEGTWDSLKVAIKEADSYIKSGGEMTGEWFGNLAQTTIAYMGIGAATGGTAGKIIGGVGGATAGSMLPGAGTVAAGAAGTVIGGGTGAAAGAFIGALVGLIGGIIDSSIKTNYQRNQNERYASQLKSQLQSTVDQLVAYSLAKHDRSGDTQKYYDELQSERASSEPTQENVSRNNLARNLL